MGSFDSILLKKVSDKNIEFNSLRQTPNIPPMTKSYLPGHTSVCKVNLFYVHWLDFSNLASKSIVALLEDFFERIKWSISLLASEPRHSDIAKGSCIYWNSSKNNLKFLSSCLSIKLSSNTFFWPEEHFKEVFQFIAPVEDLTVQECRNFYSYLHSSTCKFIFFK